MKFFRCLIFLSAFFGGPAFAGSLVVAPTTIRLGSPNDVGILYVTNRGTTPINAQIEALDWSQAGGQDQLGLSNDLVVSPPMAHIAPGATQTVRFKSTQTAASSGERDYRLLVSEIPDSSASAAPGVNILLQFSVPVFIAGGPAGPLVWDAALSHDGLTVSARNLGATHVRMTQIALADGGRSVGAAKGLFYILPGATRMWNLPAAGLSVGEHLRVEGRGQDASPITADIVIHG